MHDSYYRFIFCHSINWYSITSYCTRLPAEQWQCKVAFLCISQHDSPNTSHPCDAHTQLSVFARTRACCPYICSGNGISCVKCKNQGYNENHICNISNFSKIHHQAERKKSLIKQIWKNWYLLSVYPRYRKKKFL